MSGAYRAAPVQSLQAEVGIPPPALNIYSWQARFRLRSAESGIDKVIGESITKVSQFLNCARSRSSQSRTPKSQQETSSSQPPTPPAADQAPLAASQLSWAKQWVPLDNPRRCATISTWANRKINTLCLQQWQSSAKSLPNPDLAEAPPGTNVLKLHKGLRMAESSLAILLRTGTNGLDAFSSRPESPWCLPLSAAVAEDDNLPNTFSSFAQGMQGQLRDEQGHLPDFSKLLWTAEGLQISTRWVKQREILGQHRGARDVLYDPPTSPSPAHDRV